MSRPFVVFAVFALIVSIALAQKFGPNIADMQISSYQSGFDSTCKARGRERGIPAEIVDARCNCFLETLKRHVSRSDWERAYTFALQGRDAEERQVMEPYMDQVKAACVRI